MNKWPKKRRVTHGDRKGFTLLEMSIVIFIIALLIMIIARISRSKRIMQRLCTRKPCRRWSRPKLNYI